MSKCRNGNGDTVCVSQFCVLNYSGNKWIVFNVAKCKDNKTVQGVVFDSGVAVLSAENWAAIINS